MVIPVSPDFRYFAPNRYLERRRMEWADHEAAGLIDYVYDEDPRSDHPAMVRVSMVLDDVIDILDREEC